MIKKIRSFWGRVANSFWHSKPIEMVQERLEQDEEWEKEHTLIPIWVAALGFIALIACLVTAFAESMHAFD